MAVWISPVEDAETVGLGAETLAINVPCSAPNCDHAFFVTYGADGSIRMRRRCIRWYAPAVCLDKHLPSFKGFERAGYGWRSLCRFHAPKCFEEKLKDLGIKGDGASALVWGFKLLQRSLTVTKAFELRDAFVTAIIAQAARPQPLWTFETAEELVNYIDRCWMYPEYILLAWIDANGARPLSTTSTRDLSPNTTLCLPRPAAVSQTDFLSTNAYNEGGHAEWSKFLMYSQSNKLVSHTIVKTCGIAADGSTTAGFFPDAERRWRESEGQARPRSTDASVRIARAQLAFLEHLGGVVMQKQLGCVQIASFENDSIRRHAAHVPAGERRTKPGVHPPFPPWLGPMQRALSHGGFASFSVEGCHCLHLASCRCSCLDSTYYGLLSAIGPCKHALYERLESEASASEEARAVVRERCLLELKSYLHDREGSKPARRHSTKQHNKHGPYPYPYPYP